MFVVSEIVVVSEWTGWLVNVDGRRNATCPALKSFQLGFGKDRAFGAGDELGKRADVHAHGFASGGDRLDKSGPAAGMGIKDQITRFGKRPDRGRSKRG